MSNRTALTNRFLDFWMLGGASVAVWLVLVIADPWRNFAMIQNHFLQLSATFMLLSIVCNNPHFMASYKIAYGRSPRFLLQHWFCLIFVPIALVGFYVFGFFYINSSIADMKFIQIINQYLLKAGLRFQLGSSPNFGQEVLSLSLWLMYFTVGWHYSKQIFGCMLTYAKYDKYPISRLQRQIIKACVFSIAIYNFLFFSINPNNFFQLNDHGFTYLNVALAPLGLPSILVQLGLAVIVVLTIAVLHFVLWRNYISLHKKPSLLFLTPWIAFYIWWVPFIRQKEFYFMLVPFFHSLQYLPFAFIIGKQKIIHRKSFYLIGAAQLIVLFIAGFLAFEFIPNFLDFHFESAARFDAAFFAIAFTVFINVHHFFIDSVIWHFGDPVVKAALL